MYEAEMVAGHMEATAIELTDPAFDRNFPVGVTVEKAADDSDTDRLTGCRWRRKGSCGKPARDHLAYHLAIDLLQRAIVVALVCKQEGMPRADGLDQIALENTAFDVIEQLAQFPFVGCAALGDFAFVPINN